MGQRLQAFLKIYNPKIKLQQAYKNVGEAYWNKNLVEKEQAIKQIESYKEAFGENETCILAFHHQWCYGRSALIAASNILAFIQHTESDTPFAKHNHYAGKDVVDVIRLILSIFNSPLAKKIDRFGLEPFRLLNFMDNEIRHDFRLGDNNDGIFIIDTITNKYAFLNIGGDKTVNQLPLLEPVSAERYLRLYYPECPEDSSTYKNKGKTEEEIRHLYLENKRLNRLFLKPFKDVEVLTINELQQIFPASFDL